MQTFKGIIRQITNINHSTSFGKGVLFYISTEKGETVRLPRNKYGQIRAVANKRLLFPGLTAEFSGEFHDDYFIISDIIPTFINDDHTTNYLAKRLKGTGVKKATVKKIVEMYGSKLFTFTRDELLHNLNEDFDELGVTIDKIVSEIYDPKPIDDLYDYMENFNYDEPVIRRIFEMFGTESVNELKKNPYNVFFALELPLAGADIIANHEGISGNDFRRLEGFMRYELDKMTKRHGDTYVYGHECLENVLNAFESRKIVYSDVTIHAIDIANMLNESKLFKLTDDGKISFKYLYNAEERISKRIKELLTAPVHPIEITTDDIKLKEIMLDMYFGDSQRKAINLLKDHVSVLTGGAGMGKTFIVKAITDLYHEKYPSGKIIFCAPTGRAAKRLSLSVAPYRACTIHHLLEMKPGASEKDLTRNQNNPIDADFIIVDEVSMVDVELLSFLLSAVKNGTRILFVGDTNQLPSVAAGDCLRDIIESGIVPVYRLDKVFRQSEDSGIITNAYRILNGEELLNDYDDFVINKYEDNESMRKAFYDYIDSEYNIKKPYECQIIEPMNKDVDNTNLHIHRTFIDNTNNRIAVRSKVMFKHNANGLEYVNGEFGVVSYLTKDVVSILSEDGTQKVLSVDGMSEELTMAYSVTIHKMQGSEADTVIIVLPDNAANMMNKQLLYTAVTRARSKVIIFSVENSINDCIESDGVNRKTRLKGMLTN